MYTFTVIACIRYFFNGTFSGSIDYICKKRYEGACYKNLKMALPVSVEDADVMKRSSDLHQWIKIFTINSSIFLFVFLRRHYSKAIRNQ